LVKGRVHPCAIVIDEQIPKGSVEMSRRLLDRARLSVGDPVVVSGTVYTTSVRGVLTEGLTDCELAMGPMLAIFLGIREGEEVDVGGAIDMVGGDASDIEAFEDILTQPQDRLEPLLGNDLRHFNGMTVEQVLDHLVRHGDDYAGKYLVVAPNPDGVGIPHGEACEDPSLNVKVWDPSE
jgi:hypothetical protein